MYRHTGRVGNIHVHVFTSLNYFFIYIAIQVVDENIFTSLKKSLGMKPLPTVKALEETWLL